MQLTIAKAETTMRNAGVRRTRQRMMIIEALLNNDTHPSAEQLYELLLGKGVNISLATVYHTLALFVQLGLIRALHGNKDALRCDPTTSAHAHAYCNDCGAIFDLLLFPKEEILATGIDGFQPTGSELSIFGYCAECHTKKTTPAH